MLHRAKWTNPTLVIALVAAVAFATLLGAAGLARADASTVPWSDGQTVVGSTGGTVNQYSRALVDHSGHLYVFYETVTGFNQANVTVAKYDISTGPAPSFLYTRSVNNGDMSLLFGSFLSVAADANGNLYCAWTKSGAYTIGHGDEVFVSTSTDDGNTWTQFAQASSPSSFGDNTDPSLAVNPTDGSLWVAYSQFWDGEYNVTVAHSSDFGASFVDFTNITDQRTVSTVWPQLGIDSHGRMYVVFENRTNAGGVPYSLYWTWSDDGVGWAAPKLFPSLVTAAFTPTLTVDAANRVHVAWYDWRKTAGGANTVHYRVSADRGTSWSGDLAVTQDAVGSNNFPSLAVHGDTVIVMWATGTPGNGLGYAISLDGGYTFHAPQFTGATSGTSLSGGLAADGNDDFYATYTLSTSPNSIALKYWTGPPSKPAITSVTARTGYPQLTVSWSAVPEQNIAEYLVFRSTDGTNYQAVAAVGPSVTSYLDYGLTNGTYFYYVQAVNTRGISSLPSTAWSGTVGPSVAQLEQEITDLQNALNAANTDLAAIQGRLNQIQSQVSSLQGNTTALQDQINRLQDQLNTLQGQQATQTMSYANLAFEIIVVVLLVVVLLNQMRRPKSPQLMMAQPGQASAPKPEDEL